MPNFHEKMMHRALVLARKGVGKTSPNPSVGCVIVKDGEIVGEGWHRMAGTPHAEVHALQAAEDLACGADVYVTLEPCSHHGKTPPCAEALISAGVARVFIGMTDPNPKVCGQGERLLQDAGITVQTGILEEECRLLNEYFIKHITTGLPFVISKSAMTMDGKIATAGGDSKWITSEEARRFAHTLRSEADAIMVGIGTVLADDPLLTARIPGSKDPLRIIVDSGLRIPLSANVLREGQPSRTIIATLCDDPAKIAAIRERGADVLVCKARDCRVDLNDLIIRLGAMGILSILLEGGAELAGAMLRGGLIDKFCFFFAPKLVGGAGMEPFAGQGAASMADVVALKNITVREFGADLMITAYPER